jgi:hypothetical protein
MAYLSWLLPTLREPPVKDENARRTPAENEPPFLPAPDPSPAGMHWATFCNPGDNMVSKCDASQAARCSLMYEQLL